MRNINQQKEREMDMKNEKEKDDIIKLDENTLLYIYTCKHENSDCKYYVLKKNNLQKETYIMILVDDDVEGKSWMNEILEIINTKYLSIYAETYPNLINCIDNSIKKNYKHAALKVMNIANHKYYFIAREILEDSSVSNMKESWDEVAIDLLSYMDSIDEESKKKISWTNLFLKSTFQDIQEILKIARIIKMFN